MAKLTPYFYGYLDLWSYLETRDREEKDYMEGVETVLKNDPTILPFAEMLRSDDVIMAILIGLCLKQENIDALDSAEIIDKCITQLGRESKGVEHEPVIEDYKDVPAQITKLVSKLKERKRAVEIK